MSSENLYVNNPPFSFYPKSIFKICLPVILLVVPLLLLIITTVITTHHYAGRLFRNIGLSIAYALIVLRIVVFENFKRINITPEKLWVELLSPNKFKKRTEIFWRDIYRTREYLIPLVGHILMVYDKNGVLKGSFWISSWKQGPQLKQLITHAAILNGGIVVSWKRGVVMIPQRFINWIKNRIF